MNFRRSRNEHHAMVVTHLADVTDRIDRSDSPRGGGEERELDNLFKESMPRFAALHVRNLTAGAADYCTRLNRRCSFMHGLHSTFFVRNFKQKIRTIPCALGMPRQKLLC